MTNLLLVVIGMLVFVTFLLLQVFVRVLRVERHLEHMGDPAILDNVRRLTTACALQADLSRHLEKDLTKLEDRFEESRTAIAALKAPPTAYRDAALERDIDRAIVRSADWLERRRRGQDE